MLSIYLTIFQIHGKAVLPNGALAPSDCGKECFVKQKDYIFPNYIYHGIHQFHFEIAAARL